MADTVLIKNTDPAGMTYDLEVGVDVGPGDTVALAPDVAAQYLIRDQWSPADAGARKVVADLKALAEAAAAADGPDDDTDATATKRRARKEA